MEYNPNDQITVDGMGAEHEEKDHLEDLCIDGRIKF
jgi:hypothetical protein